MSAETITFALPTAPSASVSIDLAAPVATPRTSRRAPAVNRGKLAAVDRASRAAELERNRGAAPVDRRAPAPTLNRREAS